MLLLVRERLVSILVSISAVILIAILYLTYTSIQELVNAVTWTEHTQEVLLESDRLAMSVKDTQVNGRVYLITKDTLLLNAVSHNEKVARAQFDKLRVLVSDNHLQVARVDSLKAGDQGS